MRAFPILTWQDIQKRYAYHFGEGSFAPHYSGEKQYPAHFTYAKTDEARAEQAAQKSVSISPSPVTGHCSTPFRNQSSIPAAG